MNRGVEKEVGDSAFDTRGGEEGTPLGGGLSQAIRGRYRQNPGELMRSSRVNVDSRKLATQQGLRSRSDEAFKNKDEKKRRRKLDVSF